MFDTAMDYFTYGLYEESKMNYDILADCSSAWIKISLEQRTSAGFIFIYCKVHN